jgi:divalent metal cation (Fe/Co/Zn/Cd) transporter
MVLFDGVYSLIGLSLSGVALWASRTIAAGPVPRYPYGRESLVPLVITLQGVALAATCVYAAVDTALTIRARRQPGGTCHRGCLCRHIFAGFLGHLVLVASLRRRV